MECGCYHITPLNRDDLSNDMATGKLPKGSPPMSGPSWQLLTDKAACLLAVDVSKNNVYLSSQKELSIHPGHGINIYKPV